MKNDISAELLISINSPATRSKLIKKIKKKIGRFMSYIDGFLTAYYPNLYTKLKKSFIRTYVSSVLQWRMY